MKRRNAEWPVRPFPNFNPLFRSPYAIRCSEIDLVRTFREYISAGMVARTKLESVFPCSTRVNFIQLRRDLRLPRPCSITARRVQTRRAILLLRPRQARRPTAETSLGLGDGGDLLVFHFDEGAGGSSPALDGGSGLLVCRQVEGDEEQEVGGEDADAGNGGEFLAGAGAGVWQPGEVGGGEVCPRSEIDETLAHMLVFEHCQL